MPRLLVCSATSELTNHGYQHRWEGCRISTLSTARCTWSHVEMHCTAYSAYFVSCKKPYVVTRDHAECRMMSIYRLPSMLSTVHR